MHQFQLRWLWGSLLLYGDPSTSEIERGLLKLFPTSSTTPQWVSGWDSLPDTAANGLTRVLRDYHGG